MTTSWLTPTWSLRTSSLSTQTTPSYTTLRRSVTTAGMKAGPRTKIRMLNKQGLMQAERPGRLLCGRPFGCKFSSAEAVNHPHVFPLGTHLNPGRLWLVFAYLHVTMCGICGETFLMINRKIHFLKTWGVIAWSSCPSFLSVIIIFSNSEKTSSGAWNMSGGSQVLNERGGNPGLFWCRKQKPVFKAAFQFSSTALLVQLHTLNKNFDL